MRGTIVAYYIYLIIFVISLVAGVVGVGGSVMRGSGSMVTLTMITVLPGLLFTGWLAYVLKGCVDVQKAHNL